MKKKLELATGIFDPIKEIDLTSKYFELRHKLHHEQRL
jgi:hypothetical protein